MSFLGIQRQFDGLTKLNHQALAYAANDPVKLQKLKTASELNNQLSQGAVSAYKQVARSINDSFSRVTDGIPKGGN